MQEPVEIILEVRPGSLFAESEVYQGLYLNSLAKQGFSSFVLIGEKETPSIKAAFNIQCASKTDLSTNKLRLADRLLFIQDQNFLCLGLEDLLRSRGYACTLGLRLATENSDYPYFDSAGNSRDSVYFDDNWIDAYQYAGVLACESQLLVQALTQVRTQEHLIKSLSMNSAPASFLLGGFNCSKIPGHSDFSLVKTYLSKPVRPCLFLDRDGILNVDNGYPHKRSQFEPIDEAIPLIKWARSKSWWVVVVTNQAGLAKEVFNEKDYLKFSDYLKAWLSDNDANVDAWYYCPYHPEGKRKDLSFHSLRRKPYPGLVLEAMAELPIDLKKSIMIGDKDSDVLNLCSLNTLLIERSYPLKNSDVFKVSNHQQALKYLKSHF